MLLYNKSTNYDTNLTSNKRYHQCNQRSRFSYCIRAYRTHYREIDRYVYFRRKNILIAIIVYIVGRFLISLIQRVMSNMLSRRKVEISIQTFLKSLVSILLNVLLIVSVVGALGINTTSFAALLASAGVAIGMALSGNLQNLPEVLSFFSSNLIK